MWEVRAAEDHPRVPDRGAEDRQAGADRPAEGQAHAGRQVGSGRPHHWGEGRRRGPSKILRNEARRFSMGGWLRLGGAEVLQGFFAHKAAHTPRSLQGYLAHKKTPTPLGQPNDPVHRPTVQGTSLTKRALSQVLGGWARYP